MRIISKKNISSMIKNRSIVSGVIMKVAESIGVDGKAFVCTSDMEVSIRLTISDVGAVVIIPSIVVGASVVLLEYDNRFSQKCI